MLENYLECNGWLFKQGHFIATSMHEYYMGANYRGMQRAFCFRIALIFTEGQF